ncbi:50S ribosomal protein L25 [Haliangium sp.]|uniref:50S ribosomal protein L25 n=1 Tax=Haliangium sp. TaxID=2663208 RepID=UPI003D0A611E
MEAGKLTVNHRRHTGKGMARKLRAQGRLPGICYGVGIEDPISIEFDNRAFRASLDPGKRRNTLIDLTIEGGDGGPRTFPVMVKDYQIHPIRRELEHVDFVAVDPEAEIEVDVPLEFTGKSKGVVLGGVLHVVRRRLDVRCKPANIPTKIDVDISNLDANDALHVSDLSLPAGANAATPPQLTVITCTAPEADEAEAGEGGAEAAAAE